MNIYKKFYLKTPLERIEILKNNHLYESNFDQSLSLEDANLLSENVISTFELPFGVAPNFVIDDKHYVIPLVTEEPSVIAALSNAAKLFSNEGFKTHVHNGLMIGQIFFNPIDSNINLDEILNTNETKIFEVAQLAHLSIYKRGGGLKSIKLKHHIDENNEIYYILYLYIDTLEAMGANIVNTIVEEVANYLRTDLNLDVLMAILSNLATERLVTATCKITPENIEGGLKTLKAIERASLFSEIDIHRASTHNKGIMNGIDAFFLATGNDTRAIEAACHSYAAIDGAYKPLSTWRILDNTLVGHITIPVAIGSVGHQINALKKTQLAHKILGNPNAKTLMSIAASVGLAQNFAALYALTTKGIQSGHMKLHARAICLNENVNPNDIDKYVNIMIKEKNYSADFLKSLIKKGI